MILVSDGRETCEMDPCAVGERLEQTGVDFTAHVIGFDVSAHDQQGLSCLAERTGGGFLAAANAAELSDALMQISAPPPLVDVTLRAVIAETGEVIDDGLVWTLRPVPTGEAVLADEMQPQPRASLYGGRYLADVLWIVTEDGASKEFEVAAGADPMTVTLDLAAPIPDAAVIGPPTAEAGTPVDVGWEGPGDPRDYITVARPDQADTQYESYVYTREGAPLEMTMPAEPGSYEIRYVQRQGGRVLARMPIEVTAATARLAIPPSAAAGGQLQVFWEGPGQARDTIVIAAAGSADDRSVARAQVDQGNPLVLTLPNAPGAYEVRYIQRVGGTVLARQPLTLE